ncbi:MAG: hypothetical protein ACI3V3_04205 [Faecousia sp.]
MGALERMKAAGAEMASAAGARPRPTASSKKDSGSALERMKAAGNERVRTDAASTSPTVEKADSWKAAETSKKERLAALREEKGRLEAGLDLDGASRVQAEITQLEKDMGLSFWQRLWNTEKGGVKSSAAGMTDATRALYESGQSARTARDTDTMSEYNRSLERAKYDMGVMLEENAKAPGTWTDRDIQSQQNIIDDWQRKYDAMAKVTGEQVQQKATAATAQLADTVQESAQKDIKKAKDGLGTAGRLLVDAGAAGTQMLGDAAANLVAPGMSMASMGFRGFGSGAQQARRNGATLAQQLGYGAASAGVEVLSEKLFDGLAGIYGGGAADDIIEGVIRKMAKSKAGQRALHVLASGAGEAAEEIISGAISPALESIYDGKNPLSHYSKETVTDILHDAAVGGILGGVGGAASVVTGKYKPGEGVETAKEAVPDDAGTRTAQQAGVDMAQAESAAETPTGGNGHAASGDVLLDAIVRSLAPVTNRQAEAILSDPASSARLVIDTNGMTKAQQRAAVKDRVQQMQREVPGEQAYDPANDTILQAVTGGISTRQDVENKNAPMEGGTEVPASGTVGAAAIGFETPWSQSTERTSNLDTGAAAYTMREGEATSRTREEYDAMFRYRTQTEEQSMQAANDMLYYQVDGQPTFLMDLDPESYQAITDSLRQAPAWNGVMADAAMLIKRELMGRSIDGTVSEDVYTEWLETMREHATETGRGTQAWSKWTRRDNSAGQATEVEAWDNLKNSNLSEEERTQRFRDIVRFDRSIEAAQTDADLRQIILDIARQRGTLSGLTGKQSKLLERIANASLNGMTFEQLKQFAYSSSAALSGDATQANIGFKLKTIQMLNMLSSPKTTNKNIAGNTTFYGLDAMTMRGAALLDMALSRVTGTRSVAMESSIFGDRQAREDMVKAIRMSLAEITMDVDMGDGDNRYQQGGNRTFKAGGTGAFGTNTAADRFLERVLSTCERNMGYLLTTTDEAYKGMARSTQRGTQKLVDQGKIKNAGKDYARNQADSLATYRTFQNSGKIATVMQGLHDMMNLVGIGNSGKKFYNKFTVHSFGLGDLVAPFTRVAGNLASVGVDYSPVNAVKGTVEILDTIRSAAIGGNVDPAKQAKAVSDFARGMSGTAIAYGVMLLAQAGIVKRAEDEEDEDVASLNRSEGMVGTQVNIDAAKRWMEGGDGTWQTGDTLIDMSNLEPINFIVSLGVELADNETNGFLSIFGDVDTYKDTYTSIKNAAGDLPILSGVGDFAKDVLVYKNDPLESGAEMLGKTAISSVTPNAMAALAKGLDDKQRSVYSGDTLTSILLDTMKSRFPGLRETLPTTVNTLGQEVDNPGTQTQRILNAMFNPLGVNQYNQSGVSQEMERVRKATGETGFYPATRKPESLSYTDKDGKEHEVELDYGQKQRFQAVCGATQMNLMADMMGSAGYKSSGAERQADLLNDVYSYAYQYAKAGVMGADSVDKWVKNTMSAQKSVGLSPTTVILYRDMLSLEKKKASTKEANSSVRQQIFRDGSLNAAQKAALDDIVISDGIYIPKEVNVDYSSYDAFIISQMSDGAQKRYDSISAQFGMDAETYEKAWNIYQDDSLKADEKRAKLYGMGLNGQALYKEFGKKIS